MRKRSTRSVKSAADRAEARSKGKPIREPKVAIDAPIVGAAELGRPTDFDPAFVNVAAEVCSRGGTIEDLAERLKVSRSTVYLWKSKHEAFSDAIRVGREASDERVGFSLYERAVGYTYDTVKILQNNGEPVIVPYKEHVPPDVGAAKHWLANRQPEKWGNSAEGSGSANGSAALSGLELARRLAFILQGVMTPEVKQIEALAVEVGQT